MVKKLAFCMHFIFLIWNTSNADVLEQYINYGLENNLALQQQSLSLKSSLEALKQARSMFLPSISVEARYSRAGGGRTIDIPIGTLMNPVYRTLNQLVQQTAPLFPGVEQPPPFPENIPDETVPFLREEEQETKIRLIQPLFQPALYHNYKIKSNMKTMKEAETAIYKRQLVADIKSTYLTYLKTMQVVELFRETRKLLEENLRVSEKLVLHDKATEEVVFQAKAEISKLDQDMENAKKQQKLAGAYFNFLINKPLDSPIETMKDLSVPVAEQITLEQAQQMALKNREEFTQLGTAVEAAKYGVKVNTSSFLPGITGVVDYGFQGEEYSFTKDDDYWMASIIFQWNLFNGFQDYSKRKQAIFEQTKLELQLTELENKIKLQVQEAYDNLIVAQKTIVSANDRVLSTRKSFRIISKKFEQGMIPQIEYLNSRNSYTNAEHNYIIVKFDFLIRQAEFERVIALH